MKFYEWIEVHMGVIGNALHLDEQLVMWKRLQMHWLLCMP